MAKHSEEPTHAGGREPYRKRIATNRRARHDYHIEEVLEAGIELRGSEVKSLRQGQVDFADAYARVADGQCWLIGLRIPVYEKTFVQAPDPARQRRLLLHKRQLNKLQGRIERAGYTVVPLELYFQGSWAKVKLGVATGKSKRDKRHALKADEARREIDRVKKGSMRR